jgi:hypothetical protein
VTPEWVTGPDESAIQRIKQTGRTTPMAEHKHGSMNTDVQEKTFEGFIKASTYVACVSIAALIFLAIFNS